VSPALQELVDQVRSIIYEVLAGTTSRSFLVRVDAVLTDWSSDKLSAAQAVEEIEKMVSLFIDVNKVKEIASRCAPIVMKTLSLKK